MGDVYPKVTLASVQAAPVFLDREASVDKACSLIEEAGRNGADIAGFPECFIPGFPHWYQFFNSEDSWCGHLYVQLFKNAVTIPGPAVEKLCRAAEKSGTCVVMGVNEKEAGTLGTLYNTQLFIGKDGTVLGKHRKIVPTKYERLVHGAGDGSTLRVFDTGAGEVGGLICGENTNPLARFVLAAKGEKYHVASWPAFATEKTRWLREETIDLRVRYHAYEVKCFVISSTGIFSKEMAEVMRLTPQMRETLVNDGGHSSIINPKGQFIAGPLTEGEGILYAGVDLEEVIEAKMQHDITGHYNRFDIFRLYFNDEEQSPICCD